METFLTREIDYACNQDPAFRALRDTILNIVASNHDGVLLSDRMTDSMNDSMTV